MVPPPIDFMDISTKLVGVPSMAPRPTATNIKAVEDAIVEVVCAYPSQQSEDFGFQGMVQAPEIYALVCNEPWRDWADPGPTPRGTDANPHPDHPNGLTTEQARAEKSIWEANKEVFFSQQNMKRAIIDTLNRVVPKAYRRLPGNGIGVAKYKVSNDPRDILRGLRDRYGQMTPDEKRTNDARFAAGWNHANETIEEFFDRLEDCYSNSIRNPPPYTMDQLVYNAKTAIQETGLYSMAILEWNGFDPANQNWGELKTHFTEAYDLHLRSAGGTARQAGYHGVNNAEEDDDSINSIQNSIANIQLANNANAQQMNDNISAMTEETRQLRALINAQQQQLAMLAQAQTMQPPTMPTFIQPMQTAYNMQPPPYVPTQAPPPPQYNNHQYSNNQHQQGGRGGGGGRGRRGGNRNRTTSHQQSTINIYSPHHWNHFPPLFHQI